MANYEGGSVEIQIKSTADKARASLEALSGVIKQIKGDFQHLIPVFSSINKLANGLRTIEKLNMGKVSTQIDAVGQAMEKMSANLARTDLSGFNIQSDQAAQSLNRLTNSFRQLEKLQYIDTRRVYQDLDRLGRISTFGIEKMATALRNIDLSGIQAGSTAINSLVNSMNKIQGLKLDESITGNLKAQLNMLAPSLTQFLQQLQGINADGLKPLISALRELPKAMERMQALDLSRLGTVFTTLSTQIRPFLAQLREASAELQAFANITKNIGSAAFSANKLSNAVANIGSPAKLGLLARVKNAIRGIGVSADKSGKSLSSMFSLGKIYFFLNYTKRAVQTLGGFLKSAIDFTEVENLFSRSMGNMRSEAIRFQNTLAETFGLALPDMMESQALFNNIVKQLGGINEAMSYGISETLTMMSLDFAALYNQSIETAFDTFQAALTGQVKPVRRIAGMDITQTTLQTYLDEAGINRTIRSLNQVEKRLLTVYTLQRQMAESRAIGTYAQEIENAANQLKILTEQVKEFGRWLGAIFMGTIGKVLPYLNGFIMALKEIAKTIALFVGYKIPETTDLNSQLGLEDAVDGVDGVAKGLEKIKNTSTSIDELNIVSPEQAGAVSGVGDMVDPAILGLLTEYDNLMEGIRMKALDIRDAIMEWLGFTQRINAITGEITWDFDIDKLWLNLSKLVGVDLRFFRSELEKLARVLATVGSFSWKGIEGFYKNLLVPIGQWLFGEDSGLTRFTRILRELLENINWQNLTDSFNNLWAALSRIATFAGDVFLDFLEYFISPTAKWIIDVFIPRFNEGFSKMVEGINWNKLRTALKELWDVLSPFAQQMGEGLLAFYEDVLVPLATWVISDVLPVFLKTLSIAIKGLNSIVGIFLGYWEDFKTNFLDPIASEISPRIIESWESFNENLNRLITAISESQVWEDFKEILIAIEKVLAPIITFLYDIQLWFLDFQLGAAFIALEHLFKDIEDSIGLVAAILRGDFSDAWEHFRGLMIDNKIETATSAIDFLKEKFNEVKTAIGDFISYWKEKISEFVDYWSEKISAWWNNNVAPWFTLEKWKELLFSIGVALGFAISKFVELWAVKIPAWWNEHVKPWFTLEKWKELFGSIKTALQTKWSEIVTWWTTTLPNWWNNNVAPWFTLEKWKLLGVNMKNGLVQGFQSVVTIIISLLNKIITGFEKLVNDNIVDSINSLIRGFNSVSPIRVSLLRTVDFRQIPVPQFKDGGFPEDGFFFANHNELIGQVAGRTAVANNEQIVAALEGGVERAMARALSLIPQSQQRDNRPIILQVGEREIARAVRNGETDLGNNPIGGAFANA